MPTLPPVIHLDVVNSTNEFAQELLRDHQVIDGTCITAAIQTDGRGQRGNKWVSGKQENLTFSVIFLPLSLHINRHFLLNIVFSLAVKDYLQSRDVDAQVKWPNDIIVNDKKIAGILIENSIRGEQISSVIAGFGVNINQKLFEGIYHLPPTSLSLQTEKKYVLETELYDLLQFIYQRFHQISKDESLLRKEYKDALYRMNKETLFKSGDEEFSGQIKDVGNDGILEIEDADGRSRKFLFNQVKMMN